MAAVGRLLGALARGGADIALPTSCPGCGAWDVDLCPQCRALARRECVWSVLEAPGAPDGVDLCALGAYEGALRRLVLAAKHSPRRDLGPFLAECGEGLGAALAGRFHSEGSPPAWDEIWVVPAPSSWRRRLRSRPVTAPLAAGVASALASLGACRRASAVDCVRLALGARSQSGKSGAARRAGRAGSMRALAGAPPGAGVVVVDDVVTTGATMREVIRVLGGCDAVAAVCAPGRVP